MNQVKEKEEILLTDRAWVEINLNNLTHNINEIKKVIPKSTKIMAVVKANAYGHGMTIISKKLEEIGINDFAVATLKEAIDLRKSGIRGNILILGYTDINDLKYVIKYDLIQTIVDYEYAISISKLNLDSKLKAHIKINTGMNRLGESYKNIDNIKSIFKINNIDIKGMYTHLCVSDSEYLDDINFTNNQINNFYSLVNRLKQDKFNLGKIHIQASYGILNYPELNLDYVRPGIIMYGVYSNNSKTKIKLNLKPVLSLKARVTSIKEIEANESVSYGRIFKANKSTKVAHVSIGYADGIPRELSDGIVRINNKFTKIIGKICMDGLMIDVSNIDVKVGDIVTLIGNDIKALDISKNLNTITNELLSRLGNRLALKVVNY